MRSTSSILFIAVLLLLGSTSCKHTKTIAYTNEKYTNSASKFLDLGSLKVHYRDEGDGKPIVMVHGLGGFLQMWDGWAEDFSKDHRVIRMDLPMAGLTGPIDHLPDQPTIDVFVEFLHGFIMTLGIDDFHLAGNSLGGWIAWEYAVAHPEKVDKLILIDAAGLIDIKDGPKAVKLSRGPFGKLFLKSGVPKWVVKSFYKGAYGDKKQVTDERVTRFYEILNREGNLRAFYDLSNYDIELDKDKVNGLSMPTLILWGQDDNWIDVSNAYDFEKRIKDNELKVFPGLGHAPMEENAAETLKVARAFLIKE